MGNKLPDTIVNLLNAEGLGGKILYVPLKKETVSDRVYKTMLSELKAGKQVDVNDFKNEVSVKTLYKLREKARSACHMEVKDG